MVLIDRLGVSLVNSTGKVGRRRLAAAHEFGHFLVRDERLSAARAAELLWHLVDEEELPRPRMREADEILEYVS